MTPRDLGEMRTIVDRIQRGSVTREDWSNLAALVVVSMGVETVAAIAAEGYDTFVAISEPVYEGHAFRPEDYRRMYDRICAAALAPPEHVN